MALLDWLKKLFRPVKTECTTDPGTDVLMAVIRLVAEAAKGVAVFAGTGGNPFSAVLVLGGLLPDMGKLLLGYDEIPCELAALTPERTELLLKAVIGEFAVDDARAKIIVSSAVGLVGGLSGLEPHVRELLDALKASA